jgi:chromosome segregation ATPase
MNIFSKIRKFLIPKKETRLGDLGKNKAELETGNRAVYLEISNLNQKIKKLECDLEDANLKYHDSEGRGNKLINLYNEASSELAGLKWEYYVLWKRFQTSQMNLAGCKSSEHLARIQLEKCKKENEAIQKELSLYAPEKD